MAESCLSHVSVGGQKDKDVSHFKAWTTLSLAFEDLALYFGPGSAFRLLCLSKNSLYLVKAIKICRIETQEEVLSAAYQHAKS